MAMPCFPLLYQHLCAICTILPTTGITRDEEGFTWRMFRTAAVWSTHWQIFFAPTDWGMS